MKRILRVLVASFLLALATIGLAILAMNGPRDGHDNPFRFLQILGLPFIYIGFGTNSLNLAVLAQWGACVAPATLLLGVSGYLQSNPGLPPPPREPELWVPPGDEAIARALRPPLSGPESPGPGDPPQPPPQ